MQDLIVRIGDALDINIHIGAVNHWLIHLAIFIFHLFQLSSKNKFYSCKQLPNINLSDFPLESWYIKKILTLSLNDIVKLE